VTGVVTGDGTRIEADVVVVGIGVEPRLRLAREAGLELEGGISVDATLETSSPGVFAAGDVAAAWHPRLDRRLRVEHWANALNQGETAARNMMGSGLPYQSVPYFFSDQYDLGMEYRGHATSWDEVVFRGDPDSRDFVAFWLSGGSVVAALNANRWDDGDALTALVDSGTRIEPDRLRDDGLALDALVGAR
jgi:3-phenylpropionate/trans-cinnamate dioxygenase ferredoxin reductase subunit